MHSHLLAAGLLGLGALPSFSQTVSGTMPLAPRMPAPAAPLAASSFKPPAMSLGGVLGTLPQGALLGASTLGSLRLPAPGAAPVMGRVAPLALPASAKPKATEETVRRGFQQVEEAGRQAPEHYEGLNPAQRQRLFDAVVNHRVAGLDQLGRFDPSGEIGFCFGRAMAVHLIALRMGLTQDNIRKLFIVGDLRSGDKPEWRFHVATLVRGSDGAWYAVDPILPAPMEMSAWIATVQDTWDKSRSAKLYMTPAGAVLPKLDTVPEPGQETGERLIELKFDPAGREGFEAVEDLPDKKTRAYGVDPERAARYFDGASGGQGTFAFLGVRINGQWFDYRGYFAELIEAVLTDPPGDFGSGARARAFSAPAPRLRSGDLGSFRVRSLLKK